MLNMKHELTEKKAAQLLGVSTSRVSQLVKEKRLDAITVRGNVRISQDSVDLYREEGRGPGRPVRTSYATASRHTLMNAAHEVARVVYDSALDEPLSVEAVIDASRAPLGVLTKGGKPKQRELNDWWLHRSIPASRAGLDAKLASLGIDSPSNLAVRSMGLSLSDCYWLRPADADHLAWGDVNFFENSFIASSSKGWDDWLSGVGLSSPDNTSEGELPKRWVADEKGGRFLLKGSREDDQRPFNEAVATALHRRILQPEDYVSYDLVSSADGSASRCANFLHAGEEYVPAVHLKGLGGRIRATSNYDRYCRTAVSLGVDEKAMRAMLSKMIVCDAILANSDRHWRNFGCIRDVETLALRPAPLFDSGNSLWFGKTAREVREEDWTFAARPFAQDAATALAFVDDLEWFCPSALDGFADEACDILSGSEHATQPGRLDFIRRGIDRNIALVCDAARVLLPRIQRGR